MLRKVRTDTEGWTEGTLVVEGRRVFYRRSVGPADAVPILHVHGFGISGSYLMPTARLLTGHAVNVVPDLPGYGRSERRERTLGIPSAGRGTPGRRRRARTREGRARGQLDGVPDQPRGRPRGARARAPPRARLTRRGRPQPAAGQGDRAAGADATRDPTHGAHRRPGLPALRPAQRPAAVPPAHRVPVPGAAAALAGALARRHRQPRPRCPRLRGCSRSPGWRPST